MQAREADLLAYLQTHEPDVLKREGYNVYRHREHDSLVFSKNYWYWNSRGRRINALDYLIEIRGYTLVDAVNALTGGETRSSPSRVPFVPPSTPRETEKPFRLPYAYRCGTHVLWYLQRRGIHSEVLERCLRQGLLYESRYKGEAVCVFVGRDDSGKERFACVRGIGGDLKKDVSGSDKRYSFCYPPDRVGSRQLAVFEAPIDALSHATLQKLEGWQWSGYRLSLGGTSPVALIAFLERHPEISRVALYLDNDRAGRINAHRIKRMMYEDNRFRRIRVSINPPRRGKDYNEKLNITLREIREKPQPSRHKQAAISI